MLHFFFHTVKVNGGWGCHSSLFVIHSPQKKESNENIRVSSLNDFPFWVSLLLLGSMSFLIVINLFYVRLCIIISTCARYIN